MCCKCRTDKGYTADKGCCLPLLCLSFSYSQLCLTWHTALLLSSASGALCALLIHVCDWLPAGQLKPVIQHFSANHIYAPIGRLLSPAHLPDQQETCLVFGYLYLDMPAVSRSCVFTHSVTHTITWWLLSQPEAHLLTILDSSVIFSLVGIKLPAFDIILFVCGVHNQSTKPQTLLSWSAVSFTFWPSGSIFSVSLK